MGVIDYLAQGWRAFLLTAGLYGCYSLPEECRKSNDATTLLSVQETDGEIASFHELERPDPEGKLLSGEIVDFINETHSITNEYLPEVNVTQVLRNCRDGMPYSIVESGLDYEEGIYVPWAFIDIITLLYFNHELGHFQREGVGNETIAELNSLEQSLGMVPLFHARPEGMEQLLWWSWLYPHGVGSHLAINGFTSSESEYVQSDILIHALLREWEGNYKEVRGVLEQIIGEGTLGEFTEQAVAAFDAEYSLDKYHGNVLARKAEIVLTARAYTFLEIERQYGREVAQAYFDASSHFRYPFAQNENFPFTREDYILSTTTAGNNCRVVGVSRGQPTHSPARNAHPPPISSTQYMETTADLCCFTVNAEASSPDRFAKWLIRADGATYWNDDRVRLNVPEPRISWPYGVDVVEAQVVQQIPWKDPCREL